MVKLRVEALAHSCVQFWLWGLFVLGVVGLWALPVLGASYLVTTTSDNTFNDGDCTLREAILAANNDASANNNCGPASSSDDTITFSVSGTITLGSTLPNIVSGQGALTIDGGGNIIISGNNSVRVMWVDSGADLTLQNLTIANGNASFVGSGGGIYNAGTLTITNGTFSGNSAGDGGGIYNAGTLTITNSTFSDNSSSDFGGGIYNTATGTLTITNSTFSGNSANGGGGINNLGTLTITNSTFSGNSAAPGGGINNAGTLTLKNTIIANSTLGGDCVSNVALSGTNNNNLIEDTGNNACGLTDGVDGNIIGVDPNLGALTGSPAYFPLQSGSPAIDAGDDDTCRNPPVNNQSQNGVPRPQGAHCDVGSYESPAPATPTSTFTVTPTPTRTPTPSVTPTATNTPTVTPTFSEFENDAGDFACSDGFNNDGRDGIDCADPDCASSTRCSAPVPATGRGGTGLLVAILAGLGLYVLSWRGGARRGA